MSELAIVIPTRDRPEFLAGLVSNIAETTSTSHRIYLVMEHDDEDTKRAAKNLDTVDVIGDYGSVSHGWNAGYWASEEPFVLVTNDDVRFHDGWDIAAINCPEPIVGINDGHGRMASFILVRRSYIEQHSGVFDHDNTLVHPYLSQFCDTELADYAKHRGVWGEAPDAVVEHLHWEYGKADRDDVNYQKARAAAPQDHQTYEERKRQWAA